MSALATDFGTVEKKTKHKKKLSVEGGEAALTERKKAKVKKDKLDTSSEEKTAKKKRKAEAVDADKPTKKKKKAKLEGDATAPSSSAESEDTAVLSAGEPPIQSESQALDDPLAVKNFRLSAGVKAALQDKGISALFDIQARTLSHVLDGKDLLGRARTGCGKTLAFVLPIVEKLGEMGIPHERGRPPRVIVLAPTRELAKQVHKDFAWIGKVFRLNCACIYGGAPYQPQQKELRNGTDVDIGTPGRVKDMMEKGTLKLDKLQ